MEAAIEAGPSSCPRKPCRYLAEAFPLADNAPDSYVVKRGDTLWGIAKVFLRDPWYWPEIWQVNPQVHNPHLIYPGDTLRLVYIDGQAANRVAARLGARRRRPRRTAGSQRTHRLRHHHHPVRNRGRVHVQADRARPGPNQSRARMSSRPATCTS